MRDFNDHAIFARVAERLNFDAAARDLGLSGSTVSRRIAALEARLGSQLVLRTTRMVRLTAAGEAFAIDCRAMLEAADRAEASVRAQQDGMEGELSVNAPTLFGRTLLAPIVAEFALRHPGVRLRLTLSNARADLLADGVDLAVRTGNLPDSTLRARKLGSSPLVIVASPACLARHGVPATVSEVLDRPCLAYDRGGDARWMLGAPKMPVEMTPVFATNDQEVLRDMAIAGLGFALLPRFVTADAVRERRLAELSLSETLGASPVNLVFPGHKVPNRCASALSDHIVAALARNAAWHGRNATGRADAA